MISTNVFINTQKEFIHQYMNAPDEVSYLRYPHRHMAHIRIEIEVFDDDREIEFIMLKHRVNEFLDKLDSLNALTNNSCEMISKKLLAFVQERYSTNRDIQITVSEDGENGCVLTYRKETR